jgi:hypothetical protein
MIIGPTTAGGQALPGGAFMEVPKAPPYSMMMDLQRMQSNHQQEQQEYAEGFKSDLADRVAKVFDYFHYEYDSSGKPIGNPPTLVQGGETPEQLAMRKQWENTTRAQVRTTMTPQLDALDSQSKALLTELEQVQSSAMPDPMRTQQIQEQLTALANQEAQIKQANDQAVLKAIYGHLPDPEAISLSEEVVMVGSSQEVINEAIKVNTTVNNSGGVSLSTTQSWLNEAYTGQVSISATAPSAIASASNETYIDYGAGQVVYQASNSVEYNSGAYNVEYISPTYSVSAYAEVKNEYVSPQTTVTTEVREGQTVNTTETYEKQLLASAASGKTLGAFIDTKYTEYDAMKAAHTQEEETSPAGIAFANYQAEMKAFTLQQYQALTTINVAAGNIDWNDPSTWI